MIALGFRLKKSGRRVKMAIQVSIEALRKIDLFSGLADEELVEVGKLCRERSHEAGELCVAQGEWTDYVHFVKRGRVRVELCIPHAPYGKKITVATLGPGEIFAWSALVTGILSASVRAIEPSEVLEASAAELLALCEKNNHIGYVIMKNLSSVISSRLTHSRLALLNAVSAVGVG